MNLYEKNSEILGFFNSFFALSLKKAAVRVVFLRFNMKNAVEGDLDSNGNIWIKGVAVPLLELESWVKKVYGADLLSILERKNF